MPDDNKLYKIQYKPDQNANSTLLNLYAKHAETASNADAADHATIANEAKHAARATTAVTADTADKLSQPCGSVSQPVYFDASGVVQSGYDLSQTQPVKYSYDSVTGMATITFADWKEN